MVMKVGNINPVLFRSATTVTKPEEKEVNKPQIKELSSITPDYAVKVPQKYNKLGVEEVFNGLKIHKYKLANGHKVTIIPMEGSPATVKNYVNVGSMNETDGIKGISHFLEHMAFNGTNGENGYIKLNTGDSFKKIDELGGWTNASTNYAITDYVNSTPLLEDADLEKQIKIIAAMTEDLKLSQDMIDKEKGPVCSEINMILDNPQTVALDQTVRTLFNVKSSADELVGGSVQHIKNLTREDVKNYYDRYYTPDNMNLVITGDVNPDEVIELVAKNFKSTKQSNGAKYLENLKPIKSTVRKDFISDKATSAQLVIGFAGPKNNDVKSQILFDVVSKYLTTTSVGLSEKLKDYNSGGVFETDKIAANPNSPSLIIFGATASEDNIENVLKAVYEKLNDIDAPTERQLENIKEGIMRETNNALEYSEFINDIVGKSVLNGSLAYLTEYEKVINQITPEDVENFIKDYLSLDKAAITIVHPQVTEEQILNNYEKANLSFKGKVRKPVNEEKFSTQTLDNNVYVGFCNSKNENVNFKICMKYDYPADANPAIISVYNKILSMGTEFSTREDCEKFAEDNNLNVDANISKKHLSVVSESSSEKFDVAYTKAWEYLVNPRFDEETFEKAVEKVKDKLERAKDSSASIYNEYQSKQNSYFVSESDVRKGLETLSLEDVKNFHKQVLKTAQCMVIMNIPENKNGLKAEALDKFSKIPTVKVNDNSLKDIYNANSKPVVLSKAKPVNQADIMQTYTYESDGSIEEMVKEKLINSMMNSSSIGLFNTLREKEQLAYSVRSNLRHVGNMGECSFKILTTTDNKDIGEISYENVQKSINGFHRQLDCLLNSEYTDEDLENAKRMLKASLLNQEGVVSKLAGLQNGMSSNKGVGFENKAYDLIDKLTREDIDAFAKKMFENAPVYSIVASEDTLNANKDYLESLKN